MINEKYGSINILKEQRERRKWTEIRGKLSLNLYEIETLTDVIKEIFTEEPTNNLDQALTEISEDLGELNNNIVYLFKLNDNQASTRRKIIEEHRECHNHKPQSTPATKRKRRRTKINACKINKQILEKYIDQLSIPQAR